MNIGFIGYSGKPFDKEKKMAEAAGIQVFEYKL